MEITFCWGAGDRFGFLPNSVPSNEDILSLLKNDVVAKFSTTKSKPLLVHRRELKTEKQNFPKGRVGGKVKGSLGRHRKECAESAVNASCWLLVGLEGKTSLGAPGSSQER